MPVKTKKNLWGVFWVYDNITSYLCVFFWIFLFFGSECSLLSHNNTLWQYYWISILLLEINLRGLFSSLFVLKKYSFLSYKEEHLLLKFTWPTLRVRFRLSPALSRVKNWIFFQLSGTHIVTLESSRHNSQITNIQYSWLKSVLNYFSL